MINNKKIIITVLILNAVIFTFSQELKFDIDYMSKLSKNKNAFKNNDYTDVLGISPDGKKIIAYDRSDTDKFEIIIYDSTNFKLIKKIPVLNEFFPRKYKALFSKDGNLITFYANDRYPLELLNLRGSAVLTVNLTSEEVTNYSDNNRLKKDPIFNEGVLNYNTFFSADNKSIIFHEYSKEGTKLIKSMIGKNSQKQTLFSWERDQDKKNSNVLYFAYELDPDKFICYKDKPVIGDLLDIVLLDTKSKKETIILQGKKDYTNWMYEIKSFSNDRKKVLVNIWGESNMNIEKEYFPYIYKSQVITFDKNFNNFSLSEIKLSEGYFIKNCIMSGSGRYAIISERTKEAVINDQIILYDIEKQKRQVIFSNKIYKEVYGKDPIAFLGQSGLSLSLSGGLFLSDNYSLLAWFGNEGYVLIPLEK